MEIHFKNVGQGDSQILEWDDNGVKKFGIIDCAIYNGSNPIIEFLNKEAALEIEFIILSHLHYDHYSGMADLFNHCMRNKIKVKYFYHTIAPFLGEIFDRVVVLPKKIEKSLQYFSETLDKFFDFIEDQVTITSKSAAITLNDKLNLNFLAPSGITYTKFHKQLSRKKALVTTTVADINKLATIIVIKNDSKGVILTSDAFRNSFRQLKTINDITFVLAQAPHHGSIKNVFKNFWETLNRIDNCPVIFSVGDVPKDKLPNVETVNFFDTEKYSVYSTNEVYGISEYFFGKITSKKPISSLGLISKLRVSTTSAGLPSSQYNGDKHFNVL